MSAFQPEEPLPAELIGLIDALTADLGEQGVLLREQLRAAVMTVASSTMVDVDVPHLRNQLAIADGPLPIYAVVLDDAGSEVGELLIWIQDGWFIGIEQAWYTDDPPDHWPPIERVRRSR